MAKTKCFVATAVAALVLTACGGEAPEDKTGAAHTAEAPAPAAPTTDALVTLESSAYEAWKSKDAKFWDTFLSDTFVGYGASGRLDKSAATKESTGADCDIKSYALSDEQMQPLSRDAALFTYKATVDGTCGGQKVPAVSWAASVYVRDGDTWRGTFHAEAPVVDPKAAPAKPVGKKEAPAAGEAPPAAGDAETEAMLALERQLWEAWRARDAKTIEELTAREMSFINIFGTHFATKAEALKDWTGHGCDAKSVSVTDAKLTMVSPTVGILTFDGAADGTCFGQTIGPIWGTSVYVKEGEAWKWTFGINLPAPTEGA